MADEEKRSADETAAAAAEEVAGTEVAAEGAEAEVAAEGAKAEPAAAAESDFGSTLPEAGHTTAELDAALAAQTAAAAPVVAAREADTTGSGVHPLANDPPKDATGASDHHGHGHVAPMTMLLGVLGALIILTVMTVAVTMVDLGGQGNFVVAMIIATVKAAMVMGYFMHLVWDSKFNIVVFLSSFLFVILFLSMALLDRQEYQHNIDPFPLPEALTAQ